MRRAAEADIANLHTAGIAAGRHDGKAFVAGRFRD
jgi:hypothetical protein